MNWKYLAALIVERLRAQGEVVEPLNRSISGFVTSVPDEKSQVALALRGSRWLKEKPFTRKQIRTWFWENRNNPDFQHPRAYVYARRAESGYELGMARLTVRAVKTRGIPILEAPSHGS